MMDDFFVELMGRERKLRDHGFDSEPDAAELVEYAFSLEDRLSALCESMGVRLVRDVRGRWAAVPVRGECERW